MVVSGEQQLWSYVVVEGISAVGNENSAILAPPPSFLPPARAGVGIHQHEQLFVFRYLLHSYVQGRLGCIFIASIVCCSRGIRHKKRNSLGSIT